MCVPENRKPFIKQKECIFQKSLPCIILLSRTVLFSAEFLFEGMQNWPHQVSLPIAKRAARRTMKVNSENKECGIKRTLEYKATKYKWKPIMDIAVPSILFVREKEWRRRKKREKKRSKNERELYFLQSKKKAPNRPKQPTFNGVRL